MEANTPEPAAVPWELSVETRPSNWRGPVSDQAVLRIACAREGCGHCAEVLVDIDGLMRQMTAHEQLAHGPGAAGLVPATEGHLRQLNREQRRAR